MRITARSGSAASLAKWRAMTELLPPPCPPISACPYFRSPRASDTGPCSSRMRIRAWSRSIPAGALARRTEERSSPPCLTRPRGSCHRVASSDVEMTPVRKAGSGFGMAVAMRVVEPAAESHLAARELVLGAQLGEQTGDAAHRRAIATCDAQVEGVQGAVLELQGALELLGLDDGVDAKLAGVAMVGVLKRAFAALEQPAGAPVHEPSGGGKHELERQLAGALVHDRDERLGEGMLIVAGRLN